MYADLPGIHEDRKYFEKITSRFGFKPHEYVALINPNFKEGLEMTKALNHLYK